VHTPNRIFPGPAERSQHAGVRTEALRIAGDMGNDFTVVTFRFGPLAGRPKIYIQAATHTSELVGALALDVLIDQLIDAERNGRVGGEVILVPFANPLGLTQSIAGAAVGRFDLQDGVNFNSGWPSLRTSHPQGAQGGAPPRSTEHIRADMAKVLSTAKAATALGRLRLRLLQEAYDADIALDLHCTPNSVAFAFMRSRHWPTHAPLAAALNLHWVLCVDNASATSFEDTLNEVWTAGDTNPDLPGGCFACTIEMQNSGDFQEQQSIVNAAGLYRYLQHVGAVSGACTPLSRWNGCAVAHNEIVSVTSDRGGVVLLRVSSGDSVHEGQIVAQILEPAALQSRNRRRSLLAPCAGTVLMTAANGTLLAGGYAACAIVPTRPVSGADRPYVDVGRFD
jgi:predicted deacylase